MNDATRRSYFLLWKEVLDVQGWAQLAPEAQEEKRHEITRQATGVDSVKHLTNHQVTALFVLLRHLAKPDDLNAALPAANPDLAEAADKARRLVWKIRQLAFAPAYLQQLARGLCARHRAGDWERLPNQALYQLLKIAESRRAYSHQQKPVVPHATRRLAVPGVVEYQMRPRKTFAGAKA